MFCKNRFRSEYKLGYLSMGQQLQYSQDISMASNNSSEMVAKIHSKVCEAYERISPNIHKTRLLPSAEFSKKFSCSLYLKMEHEQRTGSFKLRGAHNKLSQMKQGKNFSVVTASSGNHGLACLDAMSKYGITGKIVVPENIAQAKRDKLTKKGADLIFHGTDCNEPEALGRKMAAENETVEYVSPYNDEDIIAGQGTLGLEILTDLPTLQYLFVSVGGGGLMAGVAAYVKTVKPDVIIVGCQPEASPVMLESIKAGDIVEYESTQTLSEGTAGGIEPGTVTFPICRDLVDHWQVLTEDDIKWGIEYMWRTHGAVVEGAAGMALAGARNMSREIKDKVVGVVLCGGNIDSATLKTIMADFNRTSDA